MTLAYQEDCFTQLLKTQSLETIIKDYSFEELAYIGFEQDKDLKNFHTFHEQATYQRSIIAQSFPSQQRLLTTSPIATLQSLAASLTIYDHPWAYYNQLLMTFCTFFQNEIRFYEHPEQQIIESFCKNTVDLKGWPFLSALFVLCAIFYQDQSRVLREIALTHQMDLSSFVSSYCGLFSPHRHSAFSGLMNTVLYTDYDALDKLNLFEQSLLGSPLFLKTLSPLDREIAHWAQYLAQELSLLSPRLKSAFDKTTLIKTLVKKNTERSLHPLFDFYAFLAALGASQSEISVIECFCDLPLAISQFRFHRHTRVL